MSSSAWSDTDPKYRPYRRELETYFDQARQIEEIREVNSQLSETQLRDKIKELSQRSAYGEKTEKLLAETYGLVGEFLRRLRNEAPHRVQYVGALALHDGKTIEMENGEGKSLVAILPAFREMQGLQIRVKEIE